MDKIYDIVRERGQISPKELQDITGLGAPIIFRHLKRLLSLDKIFKIGKSPKVFYLPRGHKDSNTETKSPNKMELTSRVIEENFNNISPQGIETLGLEAFRIWCAERKLDPEKMQTKYEETHAEYQKYYSKNIIDATVKIERSFGRSKHLDKLFYLYFYSYPIFGRTKMSSWLFYGKTLQQKDLIKKVTDEVKTKIFKFIIDKKVDSILFVPPTVPRKIQFMRELERELNLNLPKVKIVKAITPIIIQQKSLKDISDRVKNADGSLFVETRDTNYEKLLVIDDFTGSGATLNVIANKCKKQKVANRVIGLTITGSVNGFEVVREV